MRDKPIKRINPEKDRALKLKRELDEKGLKTPFNANIELAKELSDPHLFERGLRYQAIKHVNQSTHTLFFPYKALETYALALRTLGICITPPKNDDPIDFERAKKEIEEALFKYCFQDSFIRSVLRLELFDGDIAQQSIDPDKCDQIWERSISANILANLFIERIIDYVARGESESFEEICFYNIYCE